MSYWPEARSRATPVATRTLAQHNRRLRRADWRFLAPWVHPSRTICFASGQLAASVAMISDEVVVPGHNIGDCDLAVSANASEATLREAWLALRPGGSFYGEWYSPLAGGARRLRGRLQALGFVDVAGYWAWPLPNRGSALFWLPVEAPQALRHFLANRPPAPSAWSRARNALLRPLWRLALRSGVMVPMCVVARRPAGTGTVAEGDLLEEVRSNWAGWGLGTVPRRLAWLLLTGGQSSLNKVAGLVFADAEAEPKLIIKLPRLAESAAALRREAAALRAVQAARPGGLAGAPRVVFFQDGNGPVALGETVLAGRPVFSVLRRGNFRGIALRATDWLASMASGARFQPRGNWWQRLIEPALLDFEHAFGPILAPERLRQTQELLSTLGDLPVVPEQRDCSPWNVLIDQRGELSVLDWESAEPNGLPFLDLTYFLTYLAIFLDKALDTPRVLEAYLAALDPASFTGGVLAECQQRYAAETGLDMAVLRPLRLLAWLIHSRSDYKQMAAEAGGQPEAARLGQSLFFRLWQADLAQT